MHCFIYPFDAQHYFNFWGYSFASHFINYKVLVYNHPTRLVVPPLLPRCAKLLCLSVPRLGFFSYRPLELENPLHHKASTSLPRLINLQFFQSPSHTVHLLYLSSYQSYAQPFSSPDTRMHSAFPCHIQSIWKESSRALYSSYLHYADMLPPVPSAPTTILLSSLPSSLY